MSIDAQTLYQLLPAVYRNRDAEAGGALQALIQVVAEQIAVLEEDLAQLYDDQFIETCADWVVPYIGDLIGYRQLHGGDASDQQSACGSRGHDPASPREGNLRDAGDAGARCHRLGCACRRDGAPPGDDAVHEPAAPGVGGVSRFA